jgi:hypothetical protein
MLVYFIAIWNLFGHFGMLYPAKSGNLVWNATFRNNHPSEPLINNLDDIHDDDDRAGSDAEQPN